MAAHDDKYKPEYADSLPDMFANGEDVSEVACDLNISRVTFYNWVKKYPEFREAYELGKQKSEAWWCKLGRAGAAGKVNIQSATWIFNMKNKFGWADKQEVKNIISGDITIDPAKELEERGIPTPDIPLDDMDDMESE